MTIESALQLAAVIANALLVGARLDKSIKQLPARRRLGADGLRTLVTEPSASAVS